MGDQRLADPRERCPSSTTRVPMRQMGSLLRNGMVSLMSMRAVRKPATDPSCSATQNRRPSAAMAASRKARSSGDGGQNTCGACAKWISLSAGSARGWRLCPAHVPCVFPMNAPCLCVLTMMCPGDRTVSSAPFDPGSIIVAARSDKKCRNSLWQASENNKAPSRGLIDNPCTERGSGGGIQLGHLALNAAFEVFIELEGAR